MANEAHWPRAPVRVHTCERARVGSLPAKRLAGRALLRHPAERGIVECIAWVSQSGYMNEEAQRGKFL